MAFTYPPARRGEAVDDYHGTAVPDPYRWTEDPESDETRVFVAGQNAITMPYLASLPEVAELRTRIAEMWDVPRTSAPQHRNGVTVWAHNDGLQNQPVYYVEDASGRRVLLDPNTLSEDGTVAVIATSLSPDGSRLAFTVSESGSDWQRAHILDVSTGDRLDDELRFLKFTPISWHENGFFYARFPEQDPASTEPSRNMAVYFHRVGSAQDEDELIHANPDEPDVGFGAEVTDDGRFLVITEWDSTSTKYGVLYRDMTGDGTILRLADRGEALHWVLDHHDGGFLVHTDRDAPNGKVVWMPLDGGEARTVVPESDAVIENAIAAAGRIVVIRMREASHHLESFSYAGERLGDIPLPGVGSVAELSGRPSDPALFIGYQSFLHPPTALRWENGVTALFAGAEPPLDPDRVVVERTHAVSTDGAEVGMFVIRLAETALPAPVELYGYGGFNINLTPLFHPARLAFLEAGGVVAVANLRGGNELGETWHEQGMLGHKQQVFDDFIACAEKLIADGVATTRSLGIRGGSNGGLLTAAVMLQRPDLFGAVVSQVPVTDMLRYQHHTAGRYWTAEYGDAKDAEAFEWLYAYSPLHNVRDRVAYPPLLILTAETDDRVVPMHAHKFTAELQWAAGGKSENPILERIETRAGHGLGKPTAKLIDESADIFGFLLHHLRRTEP